ncbi:hypothetical protein Tco_0976205 [Tanacetum coccineum]|uniref:Gag-Pol polyprotein n=1 Tax=Tanacetum coccineum TaxID=301880 RepID=A0ABQ5EGW4_9ASTR
MHNNIMAAGLRDRLPMLATGRYAQWQSRFMRYVDTKPNGEALRKCILQEKEAIHLLLTRIRDEIYSTIDACKTAHDMWIAIEMLQHGESLNKQDVKTSLFWEFGRFTSRNGESIESYYSRFYKMMNEMVRNQLEVATMQVNVLSYAPLAKTSPSTRSHATTRHKGKEIAKPITPPSESAFEEDSDPEQAKIDKDMQKNLVLIAKYFKKIYKPTKNNLKTSSNSRNKNVDTTPRETVGSQVVQQTWIQCFNFKEFGHFSKECMKPKRAKDYTYHKEKMLLYKQAEKGVPLQVKQADWLEDTDEEVDEQELKAHYINHSEQPVSINNTCVVVKVDSNVIPNSSYMCDNENQADQNAEECDDERTVLANLIANLKLNTDENKKIHKQLKKANTSLFHELQECKSTLEECKSSLEKSNRTRDRCIIAL